MRSQLPFLFLILVVFMLVMSTASTIVLLAYHDEVVLADLGTLSAVYFPLFLVNNVFTMLFSLLYWIIFERRSGEAFADIKTSRTTSVEWPRTSSEPTVASYYDNVMMWDDSREDSAHLYPRFNHYNQL
ncbi:unnamed protein product [Caenorhabditis auriculariae]|uniref:Uncharacterized protein n=1 Tax=Caenorhabditis auriculariae TaxID=2777116 RepID=A0A8S1GX32_9PELO|nr:unnamed protein product [Caenorhabditis auriculariae]